jgi:hypothetical protein
MAADEAGPSSGRRQSDVVPHDMFPNIQLLQQQPSHAAQLAQLQAQFQAQQGKKREPWGNVQYSVCRRHRIC